MPRPFRPPWWLVRVSIVAATANALIFGLRPMFTYRALEFGASASVIGLIAGAYATLPLVFSLAVGRWTDRFGPRLFIVLGSTFCLASASGTGLMKSVAGLAAMHAVLGLGHVALLIGMQTLISEAEPQADRDRRIAVFTVGVALGQMTGPFVAGLLYGARQEGFSVVVTTGVILGIVTTLLALSLFTGDLPSRSPTHGNARGMAALTSDVGSILRTRSVPLALMVSLLTLTTTDLIVTYLPAYGEMTGLEAGTVGQLLAVMAGGSLVGRLCLGPLLGWLGRKRTLVLCLALPAVALVVFFLLDTSSAGFIALAMAGFGLGLGPPTSLAALVAHVRLGQRGTAIGARLTTNRVGQLLMPTGVGVLADVSGLRVAFMLVAGVLTAGAGVLLRDLRRADSPPQRS